jgi:hypothetical protein
MKSFKKNKSRNNRKKNTSKFRKRNYFKKSKTIKKFKGGEFDENTKNLISLNIQNKNENFSKLLQSTCKNPDNCLALGPYNEYIKHFFNNFRDLSLIDNSKIKLIGKESANGFILELPFKKLNYTAYTILKCSRENTSDNLYYEYFVGKNFINKYINKIPCFVETYGLYKFKDIARYNMLTHAIKINTLNAVRINNLIDYVDVTEGSLNMFKQSCINSKTYCVLIQHFDRFETLHNKYTYNFHNIKYDLYNILYQIYYGLCYLGRNYTHYDLHANNVGLYKPFDGNKCILMRYHSKGVLYEFKSEYVVKIIDYGRNYFSTDSISPSTGAQINLNTKKILDAIICPSAECKPNCGIQQGYDVINGSKDNPAGSYYWINPTKPNISIDLRLSDTYDAIRPPNLIYDEDYGTEEYETTNPNYITTIFNMKNHLETMLNGFNQQKNIKKYDSTWQVAATMDIFDDGREYTFNVLPDTS